LGRVERLVNSQQNFYSIFIFLSENRLSEAIIRRCYRCSVPFVKLAGCNQMSCRCGAVQVF